MKIAFYLRLSIADGDLGKNNKDESNSIENQRILLQNYLISTEMCTDDEIAEYIDDGYSGLNFNRPAFQRMIEDAKIGKIDTIIVKDLSRLGRDYIGVGDYLEQIFPVLGVRFIAVNSYYDSNDYIGRTMGLEMSFGNLINTLYCKDISKKFKSALQTKWKQGISTAGRLPFGYVKDKNDPHKWVIDPEAAKYVRLIFDLALKNYDTRRITDYLNEHNIPTPGQYRVQKTGEGVWNRVVSDEEWMWDTAKVWRILKTYSYTGAMVHGKTSGIRVGGKERRSMPVRDQFIVDGVHEGIITVEEFENAQIAVRRMSSVGYRQDRGELLTGKIRCGNCRLTMNYQNISEVVLVCNHRSSSGNKSTCEKTRYDAKRIEGQVWYALRQQLTILENIAVLAEQAKENKCTDFEAAQRNLQKDIEDKKSERIRAYENYVAGHLEKDVYLQCKAELTEEINKLTERLAFFRDETDTEDGIFREVSEIREQKMFTGVNEKLTRAAVQTFIDTIYVYSADKIEITFTFDDVIERAVAYIEQHTEVPSDVG